MQPVVSERILLRAFERDNDARLAKILFSLARRGEPQPLLLLRGHPFEDEWMDFAIRAVRKHQSARAGLVYVVANPVFRGLLKIGSTSKSVEERMRSLRSAGVVGDFVEVFRAQACDRFAAEAQAHRKLGAVAQRHKEFFATDWKTACDVVHAAVNEDNCLLKQAFSLLSLSDQSVPDQQPVNLTVPADAAVA